MQGKREGPREWETPWVESHKFLRARQSLVLTLYPETLPLPGRGVREIPNAFGGTERSPRGVPFNRLTD